MCPTLRRRWSRCPQNRRDGGTKRYREMKMPAKTPKEGQAQGLGSNPDPYADRDNRQRYDDHQQINRQPCGYALCRLGHSVSLRGDVMYRKRACGCERLHKLEHSLSSSRELRVNCDRAGRGIPELPCSFVASHACRNSRVATSVACSAFVFLASVAR